MGVLIFYVLWKLLLIRYLIINNFLSILFISLRMEKLIILKKLNRKYEFCLLVYGILYSSMEWQQKWVIGIMFWIEWEIFLLMEVWNSIYKLIIWKITWLKYLTLNNIILWFDLIILFYLYIYYFTFFYLYTFIILLYNYIINNYILGYY